MRLLLTLLLLIFSFSIQAQDNKDLARVYFNKALKSFEALNLEKTTKYLQKNKELNNGITQEKIAIFGSKFFYDLGDYIKAEEYFKAFFKLNKNKSSQSYKDMLVAYTNNLDAKDSPNKSVNKLKVLKQKKEKQDALDNAKNLALKKQEIARLKKAILSLEKSLSYVSNKNSDQYKKMKSSLDKMKEDLNSLGGTLNTSDTNVSKSKTVDTSNIFTELTKKSSKPVSFTIIETPPIFPGCEKGSSKEIKNCFSLGVKRHFLKNFDANLPSKLGLTVGLKKIIILFKVDEKGNVINIDARAPHPKIKEEAIRIATSLPKMTPATQRGKTVKVAYSFPFSIMVE
ncbi:hypothetical protein BXQ17_06850 [Polaribacter sp. BM10]|uniref:energy transducer TonB n=1 Tax=Polaribacter sp. BM10 TaxID=1529069 RepID=UPI000989CF16|nr:energy transducer TonB [Polaribacter sp. BM10]AQS93791.1 hypothetical protein BXQ17_06850 [Polaribacter sp. BM10]